MAESMSLDEINKTIIELGIKAPDTGNPLSEAHPFNLMFSTDIGPSGYMKGFLRPESAQNMFVNFKRFLDYNNARMPLAAASIGLGFRNEISPRAGLLRVREFTLAEIEHFCDPQDKSHQKFDLIKDLKLPLWSKELQEQKNFEPLRDMTMEEAVEKGIVQNQTMAYFMARGFLFLTECGIREEGIRLRQHLSTEMAHYAQDCWDCEVMTSYGWIEVAGIADRAAFDLEKHAKKTKTDLNAARPLKEPKKETTFRVAAQKKDIAKEFKKDTKAVTDALDALEDSEKEKLKAELYENKKIIIKSLDDATKEFTLTDAMVQIEAVERTVVEEKYLPNVIEPSFGIGRIIYCIFEHCFHIRPEEATRTFFHFKPAIAPLKTSILPLVPNNKDLNLIVRNLSKQLD